MGPLEHESTWCGPTSGVVHIGEIEWSTQPIEYFTPSADNDGTIKCELKIHLPDPAFRLKQITLCSQSRTAEVYDESGDYITTIKSFYIEQEKEVEVLFRGVTQINKTCKSISIKLLSLYRSDKIAVQGIAIEGEVLSENEVAVTKQATEKKTEQNMQGILGMLASMQNRQAAPPMMNFPMQSMSNALPLPRQPSLQAPPPNSLPSPLEKRLEMLENKLIGIESKLSNIDKMDEKLNRLERLMETSLAKIDKLVDFYIATGNQNNQQKAVEQQKEEKQVEQVNKGENKEEEKEKKKEESKEESKEENKEENKEEKKKEKQEEKQENKEESEEAHKEDSKASDIGENEGTDNTTAPTEKNINSYDGKIKEETTTEEATKEEATKEQTTKEETTKEETTKEETTKEETTKEETTKEQTTKEQTTKEEATKEQTTKEENEEPPEHIKRLQQMFRMMQNQPQDFSSQFQGEAMDAIYKLRDMNK